MKKLIYLIGYMGSGKSTIGFLLANKLKWSFFDLDEIIENENKCKIYQIFDRYGENYFREIESKVLLEVSKKNEAVISAGGGVILKEENRKIIKQTGISIWLKWELPNLIKNIKADESLRPLYKDEETFKLLYQKREKFYEEADIVIKCDGRTPEAIINDIINKVKANSQ